MVIDFLMFTSRPSPMEWSLIFFIYIKALSDGMVIDFLMFTSRPSPMEWSLILFLYIKALSDGMVIDFLMFTSRPSPMEWSLIVFLYIKVLSVGMVIDFLCLHQCPLRWNGHLFPSSYQGPLRWNGHWFLCHNMILSFRMVEFVFFFWSRPFSLNWSLYMLVLFFLFSFKTQTKLVFLSLLIFYFDNLWKLKFHTIK